MVNKIKQSQILEIKKYIENNSDKYSKLIVFGKCITSNVNYTDYLDLAIQTVDDADADNYNMLYELYSVIDDITNGRFEITIINSKNNSSNIMNEISKGEIIYEKSSQL